MKEEKIIVSSDTFNINEEEEEKLRAFVEEYVPTETKKLLLKNFNIEFYKDKPLATYEFAMTVYWAISRDRALIPDSEHGLGLVLWRVLPSSKPLPKLLKIQEEGLNYLLTISYPTKNKKRVRRTVKIPKANYEKFKEDFKNEIDDLARKTYGNAIA